MTTRLSALATVMLLALAAAAQAQAAPSVERTIRSMTLEEKVGQLFMIHVYGRTPDDPAYAGENVARKRGGRTFEEVIDRFKPGGIIYFNWNGNVPQPLDADQVQDLSNGLQDRSRIPLLIATDQEGGVVARVTDPATEFPGAMALGATRSPRLARAAAEATARELRALGIRMTLAPVLDVNLNPANPVIGVRSFAEDPRLVSELGVGQVRGYQEHDVATSAKHFPGHGDTAVDSHYGLPEITHDRETLDRVDLPPFRAAIAAGGDAIMTAHIVVPALDDSGLPATLSRPILTDLLRGEMGFEGVVITDSLGMSGANVLPPARVPVEAFKAGADILLNPPDVPLAFDAVLEAVRSGEISPERLDASVRRILALKARRGLLRHTRARRSALSEIGAPAHKRVADEIARDSITLLRNRDGALPLAAGARVLVTGPAAAQPELLASELRTHGVLAEALPTAADPTDAQIADATARAAQGDAVVATTYTATARQQRLVRELTATGVPITAAAMRNPYDALGFPDVDGYVAAYGFRAVTVRALAAVLAGRSGAGGRLPVTVPGLFAFGSGLQR